MCAAVSSRLAVTSLSLRLLCGSFALRCGLIEQRGCAGATALQEMAVPQRHGQGLVPQEVADVVQGRATVEQIGRGLVAQVVEFELVDPLPAAGRAGAVALAVF